MSIFERFLDGKSLTDKLPNQTQVQQIPVAQIIPNTYQPRRAFDEDQINELAQSIQANGLLQPIIVRQNDDQKFEIIAGERRFRAVLHLNWLKVPAIVRNYTNQESATLALIENLQREDLNPIEEAQAYVQLEQMEQLPQKELARKIGKSQSYVANKLRLLKLTAPVQKAIAAGKISQRHGRALLALDPAQQQKILTKITTNKLTVKATEKLVQNLQQASSNPKTTLEALPANNAKLNINTIKKALQLAQKNGAQFTYNEVETAQEYQMIITVTKEEHHG
ncbi:ParB/RepB/Spo0J family partition protein [Bombilactobacillus bombi]|uniref:ParB/RepB/Spo0J family partition protein n=1 Tax=Bombilactobacillus bombi TaxID=1303590 RepID=UPI0015E5CFD0|nr:ParB/RepB/Spo0J family partition protein [Bombilactobacillus bombi]MBA1434124.1 ParB/RepB/Spo0J family partition protein [Bombilactobacillus bombi]